MKDIENIKDIQVLVNEFYDKVKADEKIGYIFHEIIGEDWSHHLPVMYSFWETVLLGKAGYTGNPVKKHIDLDKQMPLKQEHYDRWLQLWKETVDTLYSGEIANDAKSKGTNMVHLISMKVTMARNGKSIM